MTNITQVMVEEHRLILRMVALLEQNVALAQAGRFRHWQFFFDAIDFIRNYADRFHHAKEEEILFTALVANGMPAKQSPIEAMLIATTRAAPACAAWKKPRNASRLANLGRFRSSPNTLAPTSP